MIAIKHVKPSPITVRVRPVALPVEHGGWGLLFEPIILGLLLGPSVSGLSFALAALAAFLTRHPFRLAVGDRRRERITARTALAERFVILYAGTSLLFFVGALKVVHGDFLLPLLLAAPLVLLQLTYDSMGRSRALLPELAGSSATGALATAIVLAAGWRYAAAFGLWGILAARSVPTILYLRARLRLLHRKPASPRSVIIAHLVAIIGVLGLSGAGLAPLLAVAAMVILFLRAAIGLSIPQKSATAKKLGLLEVGFGAMTVFAVIVGHAIGW